MKKSNVRVAIISFAHHHAYSYASSLLRIRGAELIAVSDSDEERGREAAERYDCPFVPDYMDILQDERVDAVIVTTPNNEHADIVIAAAKHKKHVFCEKPVCLTREEGEAMVTACETEGVLFQTAFPMRFFPAAQALREKIHAGVIGKPLAVSAANPGYKVDGWFSDPAQGYGAIIDHTVHVADMLRWIFETEIKSVYAEVDTRLNPGFPLDDCGMILMELESGIPVSLDPSWSRPKSRPIWGGLTMSVIGEDGVVSMNAFNENLQWSDDRIMKHSFISWERPGFYGYGLVQSFVQSVTEGIPPTPSGLDGVRATEVALCAYESAKLLRPVTMSELASLVG